MNCLKCGKPISENDKYCSECISEEKLNTNEELRELNNRVILDLNSDVDENYKKQCYKCGQKLQSDWMFCPNCKARIEKENKKEVNNRSKIEKPLVWYFISIAACFILPLKLVWILLSQLSIVTGKIKYPNNEIINVIFVVNMFCVFALCMFILSVKLFCVPVMTDCIDCVKEFPD